jgi:hypothetical protein
MPMTQAHDSPCDTTPDAARHSQHDAARHARTDTHDGDHLLSLAIRRHTDRCFHRVEEFVPGPHGGYIVQGVLFHLDDIAEVRTLTDTPTCDVTRPLSQPSTQPMSQPMSPSPSESVPC